ncbi:BTAD domain-containing putative transcriptional regulator [Streptomyces sp. NPDC048639]|uniref:AfsR/SARP family transcriptional regulator n=1 Tax=Streptomyces sp. NPDC048639 TaxID=3365581 RepID=UPI0037198973
MRYGILGTTQAHDDDGNPVTLGGVRLRALLTALALEPGRVRTAEALIAEVWGGAPPVDAAGALHALVGRLRRALGHAAVGSVEGGYRLHAERDAVDLCRFERLAGEGARALADGDATGAAALLDEALALWRGPALADLPDSGGAAAGAEARRLEARRCRVAADLDLGRADRALPELAALCDEHPLDEPLQGLRIRALRDAGRTAEALAAYEDVRRTIAERLGADPSPHLRSLHAELLGRDGPSAGSGRGEKQTSSRPVSAAPSPWPDTPPPQQGITPARQGNMRARLTSFVGRETDLATLRDDVAAARLVTLTGPGGAGKTRLAQEAGDAFADRWPDGVWLAELAPVDDPATVAEAVVTTLGGRETVIRGSTGEGLRVAMDPVAADPFPRLAEYCGRRRMLLVLDNCEHVIGAAAELAEFMLRHCPGVSVLATSREPLGVPGELVRPVGPLPDPVAVRLLAERGAAARAGFRTDDDPAACTEICRRLDGLPLAIELAAARLRLLTPRQLADRLDDRFRLLTGGSRTVLPRQQTLKAVVDWSWDLLGPPERAVLRRLSVVAGGCDLSAAEAVCGDVPPAREAGGGSPGGEPPTGARDFGSGDATTTAGPTGSGEAPTVAAPTGSGEAPTVAARAGSGRPPADAPCIDSRDVAPLLGSLVDKSLVVAEPGPDGAMRYRLLETVGEYAAERLDEAAEREAAERRHLVHFRELARTADPLLRGPAQRTWIDRLEREHDNLRAALRRAVAAGDEHEALCLVLSLGWFWQLRNHLTDARTWWAAAAALGPDPFADPVEPGPDLHERPIDAPPPMPPVLLEEARRGVRLIGLATDEYAAEHQGNLDRLERIRRLADAYRPGQPQTCRVPGVMWFYAVLLTGDFERLYRIVDATVEGCRELGRTWELAFMLRFRSRMLAERPGRVDLACRDADESLEIFRRLGDLWGVAEALSSRGEAHERHGAYEAAAEDYREAAACARRLGAQVQVPLLRARLASVLIESGEMEIGESILREVLEDSRRAGRDAMAFVRLHLAVLLGRTGRTAQAREHIGLLREKDFAGRLPDLFEGVVLGMLAWLDILDGLPAEALVKVRQALEKTRDPFTDLVAPVLPVVQIMTGARARAALGGADDFRAAARLSGAYDALLPPGHHAPTLEREDRAAVEATARTALGDAAYEVAYAEGAGLSLDEAIALV